MDGVGSLSRTLGAAAMSALLWPSLARGDGDGARKALEASSCSDAARFAELIRRASSLALPLSSTRTDRERASKRYWQAATEVGCARAVTSSDGRVRVWTHGLETETDEGSRRGSAYITWIDRSGKYHRLRDAVQVDLHLDAIIDAIHPVPGKPDEYLILGLRAYRTTFPGSKPRRFAIQVRLTDRVAVRDAFAPGGGEASSVLLLAAASPSTGKFRHHRFACQWLVPRGATLVLETIPGCPEGESAHTVATWNGSVWRVEKSAVPLLADGWRSDPGPRDGSGG